MPALDSCFLLPLGLRNIFAAIAASPIKPNPTVEVVYCYVPNHQGYHHKAVEFVLSWYAHPAGYPCTITIAVNGSEPRHRLDAVFNALPPRQYLEHDNSGFDIGAYQHAARESQADLLVFFTATTYFPKAGWLARMVDAYRKHGEALYGAMGNRGAPGVNRHLRSTAFWCSRLLFNAYPYKITKAGDRYAFEHREKCFTEWVLQGGLQAYEVTWAGEYPPERWNSDPGGYGNGCQHNLIAGDRLTLPPYQRAA